ncbi:4'-phosphopantetheinyl transferase superfamily [Trifolium repens]|nr:4'-phosphopantetheinyl transferase superfamily [Trifolium repens]
MRYNKPRLMTNIYFFGRNLVTASCSLSPVQLPAQKEAHFWYVLPNEVKCTNLLNRYFEILSPCEKENVLRMCGEELKKSALLARALVRTTLARLGRGVHVNPLGMLERKSDKGIEELEAYVKALGRGFSASPFNTFTVRLRDQMKRGIHVPPHVISKEAEITVDPSGDHNNLSSNYQFVLLELLGSHYAAVCVEKDSTAGADKGSVPVNLTIRKTIPFVEDELED